MVGRFLTTFVTLSLACQNDNTRHNDKTQHRAITAANLTPDQDTIVQTRFTSQAAYSTVEMQQHEQRQKQKQRKKKNRERDTNLEASDQSTGREGQSTAAAVEETEASKSKDGTIDIVSVDKRR